MTAVQAPATPARGDAPFCLRAAGPRAAEYVALVRRVAAGIARGLPGSVDVKELLGAGTLGLLDAIEKYDPTRGGSFVAYARVRVRGAILDELRAMDWLPRKARQDKRRVASALFKLEGALGRAPSDQELARESGVDERTLPRLGRQGGGPGVVLAHDITPEGEAAFGDEPVEPLHALEHRREMGRVRAVLATLPLREREVLELHYLDERTLKDIGGRLGVTEGRVSQLHQKALGRLRGRLTRRIETRAETRSRARQVA